jgi:hypothetical protein
MSSRSSSEPDAPSLDFGWEEDLFSALLGIFRQLRPKTDVPGQCASKPHIERLAILARVVSGLSLNLVITKGSGGLRNHDILVPTYFHISETYEVNLAALTVHTLMGATMAELLNKSAHDFDIQTFDGNLRLAEACRNHLLNEWPKFEIFWNVAAESACRNRKENDEASKAIGLILRGEALGDQPIVLGKKSESNGILWGQVFEINQLGSGEAIGSLNQDKSQISTEVVGKNPEELKVVFVDEKKKQEMPSHIFEKTETADDYRGEQRATDGDDELDDHLTALEELDLNTMYRGGAPADSLYKADIRLALEIPDVNSVSPHENAVLYDEWDDRKGRYKKNWVQVYPTTLPILHDGYAAEVATEKRAQIAQLTRRLKSYRQQLRPQRRQFDGEDVDLEALVQETAAQRAGHGGDTRLYERRARMARSLATTVLLDISLSADSWVDNHRVLDVAREAIVVLGEVTSVLGDDLQILAFGSNTRNLVRIFELKGWSESWASARNRLGSIEPQGYTRIGPALRHATAEVCRRTARKRMVLLLSDGKPTDYDRYEGNYGIRDVRQAVREADRAGVHVFGFAIDQTARNYLPAMLGEQNWAMMPHADALTATLTDVYGRVTK